MAAVARFVDNVGEVMADKTSFPDDISALWVDPDDNVLEPPRPVAPAKNGNGSHPPAPDPATLQALETITQMLTSVQRDVSRLHEVVDGLRDEVTVLRKRTERVRGLRAGSFPRLGHASSGKEDP